MRAALRTFGWVILASVITTLPGCGGGGSDDGESVMPALLNGSGDLDPQVSHWVANVGTDQEALFMAFYDDGSGTVFIGNAEGTMFTNDDNSSNRDFHNITWSEPSNGTLVVTFVPDQAGWGIRFTNINIDVTEDGFFARATAEDDEFLEMGFTRQSGPLAP